MVTLVDQFGNPINMRALQDEPQTAKLGHLHHEFAGHPTRGLTPMKLARILDDAERGDLIGQCELFEDMEEKDAHIYSEMDKRRRAVTGLDWMIKPPRNASAIDEKIAEQVHDLILDIPNFEDVLFDMTDAIGKAYSNSEIEWHRVGKNWLPKTITHHPASWFTVDPQVNQDTLLLRNTSGSGEALRPLNWISHIHKAKSGYVGRAGLHRVLAWPFLFKNYSVRDLAEFLEIYGLPLRLGTYPSGATDAEKLTLLRAVVNIGHDAAGIVPDGMMIDFKEAAKGNKDPFEFMMDWCERSQSKAILGGTLTSSAQNTGLGSNLGDVHNEVRLDLRDADARQLESTLTRDLVYPLMLLNFSNIDPHRCCRFVFDTYEAEDLKLYADSIPKLVDVGMQIPLQHIHDKLRIPLADGKEPVLQRSSTQNAAALKTLAALTRQPQVDMPSLQTAALESQTEKPLDQLIGTIKNLLDEVTDLTEFQNRLLEIYPQLSNDGLVLAMQEALAAAQLAGRYDILDDAGAFR